MLFRSSKKRIEELERTVTNQGIIMDRMRRELDAIHYRMRNPGSSGIRRKVSEIENDDPKNWLEDPHKTQVIDDTLTRVFVKPISQWGTDTHDPVPLVTKKKVGIF